MAYSKEQKLEIATRMASGQTEVEISQEFGISRSTLQNWKRQKDFLELIDSIDRTVAEMGLINHGARILKEVEAIKEREPAIRDNLWALLDGMFVITQGVVDRARSEEINVRNLPALTDSVCKLVNAYTALDDRIGALEVVGNAVLKLGSGAKSTNKAS